MTTDQRTEQISKIRRVYDAEDSADDAVTKLRHAATFYSLAGYETKANALRKVIRTIERITR